MTACLRYMADTLLGAGVTLQPVHVVNVPAGATVAKIRMRPNEFIRVYLRTERGFEGWYCDFTDETHRAVRLTTCWAANVRRCGP